MLRAAFVASAVIEANPSIRGHHLVGFGFSVFVSREFADAEIASPRPDINSRIIAAIHTGSRVLATVPEVADANAGVGNDIVVLAGIWRDGILNETLRADVQHILAFSFTQAHAGYRIHRIFHETVSDADHEFLRRSIVFRAIAEFPELGRILHVMTMDTVRTAQASLGNQLFSYHEPILALRESDQQLLLAALDGSTDYELAARLGISFSAVKARWRSIFARVSEVLPDLMTDPNHRECRGSQKRHRVIAYVRNHLEELRPYNWKSKEKLKRSFCLAGPA